MPMSNDDATIHFSIKEMFGDIKRSIEAIDIKLDAKADHGFVVELAGRVTKIESDLAFARGLGRAAWAIVGLLVAIAGLLIPIVMSVLDK